MILNLDLDGLVKSQPSSTLFVIPVGRITSGMTDPESSVFI